MCFLVKLVENQFYMLKPINQLAGLGFYGWRPAADVRLAGFWGWLAGLGRLVELRVYLATLRLQYETIYYTYGCFRFFII